LLDHPVERTGEKMGLTRKNGQTVEAESEAQWFRRQIVLSHDDAIEKATVVCMKLAKELELNRNAQEILDEAIRRIRLLASG
jgi:hypothetical protein